ncbi:DNA polymerase [Bacillus safensis]|uniref:DNA polymerase n=1 Tax=Bacillus safensis TaxID=561879 RepID=UPI00391738C2
MNLKYTSISNLLLLPKSYDITSHVDATERILKRHKVFSELYRLEESIQPVLASMEEAGLVIAEDWFGSGLENKRTKLQEAIEEINQYIGGPKNDQIDKKILDSYWNKNGLPPANSFEELSRYQELHPTYSLMLKYKKHESYIKQWGTKIKHQEIALVNGVLIKGQIQSFSSYTGRITARNLPLTSMPTAMRDYMLAPKGFRLISLDLNNAELRFLAYYGRCDPLIKKFNAGKDVHHETAQLIQKSINSRTVDDGQARELAKRYTYSFLYGAGLQTITKNLQKVFKEVTSADVVSINDSFIRQYPEVQRFLTERETSESLQSPFGEVKPVATFNKTQRRNFTLQSSVSVAIKMLITNLAKHNIEIVHVLHDELWILVPEEKDIEKLIERPLEEFEGEIINTFRGFPCKGMLTKEKIGGKYNEK